MNNLTKRDLIVTISNETGLIQSDVFNVVQRTLDHIAHQLTKGGRVELRNFGVFDVRVIKERVGRDPKKPDLDVIIPARAVVKFKAGKYIREKVLETQEGTNDYSGSEVEESEVDDK
jgi:nucleoid DNA-binding protein